MAEEAEVGNTKTEILRRTMPGGVQRVAVRNAKIDLAAARALRDSLGRGARYELHFELCSIVGTDAEKAEVGKILTNLLQATDVTHLRIQENRDLYEANEEIVMDMIIHPTEMGYSGANLTKLTLEECAITMDDLSIMQRWLRNATRLRTLVIDRCAPEHCTICAYICDILVATGTTIAEFDLRSSTETVEDFIAVLEVLPSQTQLERVKISIDDVVSDMTQDSEPSIPLLRDALHNMLPASGMQLQEFSFHCEYNYFGDDEDVWVPFFRTLRTNTTMKSLTLSRISENDCKEVVEMLKTNSCLRELNIFYMNDLKDSFFKSIAKIVATTNTTLEVLDTHARRGRRLMGPYLIRNWAGRRLLNDESIPVGLWPVILGRINVDNPPAGSPRHRSETHVADTIYHMIRNGEQFMFRNSAVSARPPAAKRARVEKGP